MNPAEHRAGARRALQLPFALRNEALVHVSEVGSGRHDDCVCPACFQPLIARKGAIKRHHFAHDPGAQCNLESALHQSAKRLLLVGIKNAIEARGPIHLSWKCGACHDVHEGNLVKRAKDVILESDLGVARSDLLLVGGKGEPVAVIEVIVSHPIEASARRFYTDSGIMIVEVEIHSAEELEELRDLRSLHAAAVSGCTRPKCPRCKQVLLPKELYIGTVDCYRCKGCVRVCKVVRDKCLVSYARDFTDKEKKAAEHAGCLLGRRYSHSLGWYIAHLCPRCDAPLSEPYLSSDLLLAQEIGKIEIVPLGYSCNSCHWQD